MSQKMQNRLAFWLGLGLMFATSQSRGDGVPGPIPDEFIDPETHLRVVHLSRVPNDRSGVIYFTYPCITADSRLALVDTQFEDKWRYLYAFDFQSQVLRPLVTDRLTQDQVLSPKSGNVYYMADNAAWVIDVRGGVARKIADVPPRWVPGAGFSVNADESLLLGASCDEDRPVHPPSTHPAQYGKINTVEQTFEQHKPNVLFTINIHTGEVKAIHRINTWLGHVQFSPTDPNLLMFCHEGPWDKLDRIWTMRLDQGEPYCLYKRSDPTEIVGHEFWAPDGKPSGSSSICGRRKRSFSPVKTWRPARSRSTRSPPRAVDSLHAVAGRDILHRGRHRRSVRQTGAKQVSVDAETRSRRIEIDQTLFAAEERLRVRTEPARVAGQPVGHFHGHAARIPAGVRRGDVGPRIARRRRQCQWRVTLKPITAVLRTRGLLRAKGSGTAPCLTKG